MFQTLAKAEAISVDLLRPWATRVPQIVSMSWPRLSEQIIRFDKWNVCQG